MRADKNSIDYQVNLVILQEMENVVPVTCRERHCLRKWVHKGNEVESNPWNFRKGSDSELHWDEHITAGTAPVSSLLQMRPHILLWHRYPLFHIPDPAYF